MNAKKLADMFADWLPMDSPERAANFQRWRGSGEVFDGYHGTGADITEFAKKNTSDKGSHILDIGVHASSGAENANTYAQAAGIGGKYQRGLSSGATTGNPAVYPVHVRYDSALDATQPYPSEVRSALLEKHSEYFNKGKAKTLIDANPLLVLNDLQSKMGKEGLQRFLSDLGYDAVKYRWGGSDNIVTMKPENIKSRFNRGTYDPNDPNILKSIAPYALAGGGLMSALSPSDAAAIESIRQKDAPLEEAWNPVEAFGGGLGGGLRAALAGIIPDGVTDWAISGLMSGGK